MKDLLEEAKTGAVDDEFIDKLNALDNKVNAAAIGAIAVIKYYVDSQEDTAKAIWTIIDNLSEGNTDLLRLFRMKQMLFPESKGCYISITPEIFEGLQEEAKLLLESSDATDEKRYYWKSIIKGKVPPGLVIKDI